MQELARERHEKSCSLFGKYGTTENVFKGLVICADCGGKMSRHKDVSSSGKARYSFYCRVYGQNPGGKGCTKKWLGEPELTGAVLSALRAQTDMALDLEQMLESLQEQDSFQKKSVELARKIREVQRKAKRNASMRGCLFESFCDHTLTEAEYRSMKTAYDREAKILAEELELLEAENRDCTCVLSPQNEWINALKKYHGEKAVTREMAVELIRCIRVSGYNEIEIIWNFQDEFAHLAAQAGREAE